MASFNLHLQFNNKLYTFVLQSNMSLNHIKCTVGESCSISADTFYIQIYDERSNGYFVLDDEYLNDLHERLPRTYVSTLHGDLLLNYSSGTSKHIKLHNK